MSDVETNPAETMLALLAKRNSHPRLSSPAPSESEIHKVFQAALRAPDHMRLRPWRYLTIQGEGLSKLGEVFVEAAVHDNAQLTEAQIDKYRNMPLRAPMIIVGICCLSSHEKVPDSEQVISAGVGMGYMLVALQAAGYGAMWRTGLMAEHSVVRRSLGLGENEQIVGFLYTGTVVGEMKTIPELCVEEYVSEWGGN